MKRGFQTSEAQLAAATIAGQVAAALAGKLPPTTAGWGSVAIIIAYALARGLAKFGGAETTPRPHARRAHQHRD